MNQKQWLQTQWTHSKRHTHRRDGDFWNVDGLYPTPDRQQLRRAPGWSTFAAWAQGLISPGAAYYNSGMFDNAYYSFIGEDDDTGDLAVITYAGAGWNSAVTYDSIDDLSVTDTMMRGLHQRNAVLWYSQDLWYCAHADEDVYKSANLGAGAIIHDGAAAEPARMLVPHGDRIYLICETGEIYKTNDDATAFVSLYDPAPFLDIRYVVPTAHYLLLFAHMEDGRLQIFNLPLSNPDVLLPVDVIPNIPVHHPLASAMSRYHVMPWANDGENVYFLSGHYPEFNNSRVDVYRYRGSRVEKIAECHDLAHPANNVYCFGLHVWHGELLIYQQASADTWVRMLVGDRFVDFHELSGTAPFNSMTAYTPTAVYNLAGRLFFTAKSGSDEGYLHHKGYSDGHLITSWLDMDHPGHLKRLNRVTVHIQGACAGATVTVSRELDGAGSWTQLVATANSERIVLDNIAQDFYRMRLKVAIADTSSTPQDVRIDSIDVRYTL